MCVAVFEMGGDEVKILYALGLRVCKNFDVPDRPFPKWEEVTKMKVWLNENSFRLILKNKKTAVIILRFIEKADIRFSLSPLPPKGYGE